MRKMEFYLDLLGKTFGPEKPLAKLLNTSSGYFVYDTGTNKILGCRKQVYDLLYDLFLKDVNRAAGDFISLYGQEEFLSAAEEIVEAIDTEKTLQLKKASNFGLSDHSRYFREIPYSPLKGKVDMQIGCKDKARWIMSFNGEQNMLFKNKFLN